MIKFLRYNTRHRVYLGDNGFELNPICSSSHRSDGRRTRSWHEPLWLFRLRRRRLCYAGQATCEGGAKATWDWGPDGNRTCSHCGSIHFDDLMKLADKVEGDTRYGVEGTCKGYKLYVKQPGVRNASEGAIKAYTWHFPSVPLPMELDQRLRAAMRTTHQRFMDAMKERHL